YPGAARSLRAALAGGPPGSPAGGLRAGRSLHPAPLPHRCPELDHHLVPPRRADEPGRAGRGSADPGAASAALKRRRLATASLRSFAVFAFLGVQARIALLDLLELFLGE